MASGLIIVVDDDPSFRKLYSDFLTVHGYTVLTAKSGAEGMKFLLNCTPKVLILDISMPVMDGIETCKHIRRIHGNDIPILFLTAFNEVDKLRDCLHAGGDDYLIKSGNLDKVLERVKFWSRAVNRQEARIRRTDVMQEVDNTVERIDQAD
ncbi:MAG: response regulator [Proteobacteria bacterium]|nr:response regulator [Pseudomonadota bacterium]